MARYSINQVALHIPDPLLTGQLDKALASGRYESSESAALLRHLRPGDRFLDLGAGAGYLASLAVKAGVATANGVEANPEMVPVASANLARNGGSGEVIWGVVVGDAQTAATLTFTLRRAFWASSLTPPDDAMNTREVEVPTLRLGDLLARFSPTVASVDIEGGELDLVATPLPAPLRLVLMEVHPSVYGKAGVKRIFDALSAQGFCYCPTGSRGATVVFERIT